MNYILLKDKPIVSTYYSKFVDSDGYIINDKPEEENLYQRLEEEGPASLSLKNLFSIILREGEFSNEYKTIANTLLREYGEKGIIHQDDLHELSQGLSITTEQAARIVACVEIGKRLFYRNNVGLALIKTPEDVFEYVRDMRVLPKEQLRGVYLNSHHQVIHDEVLSIGTIDTSIIHPREVFKPAIEYAAAAVILVHNHPSGIVLPSKKDLTITQQLLKVSNILGIPLLDHIIVTQYEYKSIINI